MADPFEALRAPVVPTDPDPSFAARLRTRVERSLNLPRGVTVSDLALDAETTIRSPTTGVVPYLAVADAPRALDWYVEAFGARRRGEPIVMPDGRIGHAELEIAGSVVMLADEHPEIGVTAPTPGGGTSVTLHLRVDDVDVATAHAVEAGARLERTPAEHPYGRNAVVRDPFGHRWLISGEAAPAPSTTAARHGDIAYVSLWVPDVTRAAAFFSEVLGWQYAPGSAPQGRQVEATTPPHGLWGGQERTTLFLCFAVEDIEAAVQRVRAAGGQAEEPRQEPYGRIADCADDQGVRFALVQSTLRSPGEPRAATGTRQGDLAYVTMEVADSAKARAFYGSVLDWRFTPGHVEDGWSVADVAPMVGLVGGRHPATVVPMYQVDDVVAAVDRVRAMGGTASDPERQAYGRSCVCTDDQGTRFYLAEL
jgi:uncharacterized glyoxalase superfamily protein PhnB